MGVCNTRYLKNVGGYSQDKTTELNEAFIQHLEHYTFNAPNTLTNYCKWKFLSKPHNSY